MRALSIASLFVVATLLGGSLAVAGGSKAKPAADKTYHWYDGQRKRTIELDPELIAEFTGSRSAAKSVAPMSGLEAADEAQGGVRFWRVGEGAGESPVSASTKAARASNRKFSPVFRNRGGRGKRALPGGIIVTFASSMSDEACEAWIAGKGLVIQSKLTKGRQIYVIETPAGMESLELANTLHESGEVESASPNWWSAVETK